MTDAEIKARIDEMIRKAGFIVNEDGSCYPAE